MVPDRRTSKARKRMRRAHHALKPVSFMSCPRCGSSKLSHRACSNCGYVNSKVALKIESEES